LNRPSFIPEKAQFSELCQLRERLNSNLTYELGILEHISSQGYVQQGARVDAIRSMITATADWMRHTRSIERAKMETV
jgi:hypothetical protein